MEITFVLTAPRNRRTYEANCLPMYHILFQDSSFAMTFIICRANLMQKCCKSHLTNMNCWEVFLWAWSFGSLTFSRWLILANSPHFSSLALSIPFSLRCHPCCCATTKTCVVPEWIKSGNWFSWQIKATTSKCLCWQKRGGKKQKRAAIRSRRQGLHTLVQTTAYYVSPDNTVRLF